MKRLSAAAILLGLPALALCQPTVSNVAFTQESDGAGGTRVAVTYDLATASGPSLVQLYLSEDGGASYAASPSSLAGDVGAGVVSGTGRTLYWNIGTDRPAEDLASVAFRVVAEDATSTLTVLNAGFEADMQADGFLSLTVPPDWSIFNPAFIDGGTRVVGTLNPNTTDHFVDVTPGEQAPEGRRVALVFMNDGAATDEAGIFQTLSDTLVSGARYRLSVQIGNIDEGTANFGYFDLRGFSGYRVDLFAGTDLVARDDNSLGATIGDGIWERTDIEAFVDGTHPGLGDPLEIQLVNLNQQIPPTLPGIEVDFDDVQLNVGGYAGSTTGSLETIAPLAGTPTVPGSANSAPISIAFAGAADASGIAAVELWYREDSGSWASSGLTVNAASGSLNFTPPGSVPANHGTYHFQLVAQDTRGNRSAEPVGASGSGQGSTVYNTTSAVRDWRIME